MEFAQLHQRQRQSNTSQIPSNNSTISSQASSSSSKIILSPSLPKASPLGSSHSTVLSSSMDSSDEARERAKDIKNEWWKFSTPSPDDVRLSRSSGGLGGAKRLKRGEEEFKMIGKWRVGKGIGKGTSGKVRISRHIVTGEYSAIKMVKRPLDFDLHSNPDAVQREITVMKLVESPFIVRLLDVFQTESHIYLVTEYCEIGELFHFFSNRCLSEELIHKLYSQLITALSHLRLHNIAHRDIKFENLLIDSNYDLKLADFGMAIFCPKGSLLETSCGSPHYAAPEVIVGIGYDGMKADLWSSGIVLYAMISRHLPFDNDNISTLLCQIKTGRYSMHPQIQGEARDLIERILVVDPFRRITLGEVISHPYLQTYGKYAPAPYRLPFPLSEGVDPVPTTTSNLDMNLIEQLRVVLRLKTREEVVDSVLDSNDHSEAKFFYTILKNFRSRASTDESIKTAVEVVVARSAQNPRRVKSADPILSRRSTTTATITSSKSIALEATLPTSPTVVVKSPDTSIVFPSVERPPLHSRLSSSSNLQSNETIRFPSFSTNTSNISVEATGSLPNSPNSRRSISLHEIPRSLPTSPHQNIPIQIGNPDQRVLSPRSKKFSMQKLKGLFSHPKPLPSPVELSMVEVGTTLPKVIPLHVKRSTRISSFGKVLRRLSSSPLTAILPLEPDPFPSSPSSPSSPSAKLSKKKKSWARLDGLATSELLDTPSSPKSLSKKKSFARPLSWISSSDKSQAKSSLMPNSPRRISSQISTWFAATPETPPSPLILSTPSPSTKRRPSPLQLSSSTRERPASTISLLKRVPPPPFISRIECEYSAAPVTPPRSPASVGFNRPVLYSTVSESIYSEAGEEVGNSKDVDVLKRRSNFRTPPLPSPSSRNDGLLSPPLTASEAGVGYLDFLDPATQRSRKSSMRSMSSKVSTQKEGEEIQMDEMREKILRLERENTGLRVALERTVVKRRTNTLENKENAISRIPRPIVGNKSIVSFAENNCPRPQSSNILEQDELLDMVNRLSFESNGIVEEKWLKMLED